MNKSKFLIDCDEKVCYRYKMYKFCRHTIAAATYQSTIDQYIKKLNSRNNHQIVSNVVNTAKQKDSGKKKSKANQRRKGPCNKKPIGIIQVVDPQCQPAYPNPLPGKYVLALLRFIHPNVSSCYGCHGQIIRAPATIDDMVIVSKTRRTTFDAISRQRLFSPNLSNVYYHFNHVCIMNQDVMFSPGLVEVPDDTKSFLSDQQKATLFSCSIFI